MDRTQQWHQPLWNSTAVPPMATLLLVQFGIGFLPVSQTVVNKSALTTHHVCHTTYQVCCLVMLFHCKMQITFQIETAPFLITGKSPPGLCVIYHFFCSSWGWSINRCVKWWTVHGLLAWNQDVTEGSIWANCIITARVTMEALTLHNTFSSLVYLICSVHFNCYGWSVFSTVKPTCLC